VLQRLAELEALSRTLSPAREDRAPLWAGAQAYAESFLQARDTAPAYALEETPGSLPIPEVPRALPEVLAALSANVDTVGANGASPRHFAFIPPSSLFASALGDLLAAVTNRYSAFFFANPGAVRLENQVLAWLAREMGLPEGTSGNLASGGSMAHLVGICAARENAGLRASDYPRACVYLSDQAHHCIPKALRVAGLGEAPLRSIPTDESYKRIYSHNTMWIFLHLLPSCREHSFHPAYLNLKSMVCQECYRKKSTHQN
jgi:hypothetical protein